MSMFTVQPSLEVMHCIWLARKLKHSWYNVHAHALTKKSNYLFVPDRNMYGGLQFTCEVARVNCYFSYEYKVRFPVYHSLIPLSSLAAQLGLNSPDFPLLIFPCKYLSVCVPLGKFVYYY